MDNYKELMEAWPLQRCSMCEALPWYGREDAKLSESLTRTIKAFIHVDVSIVTRQQTEHVVDK